MGLLIVKEDFTGKYNLVKSDFDQIDSFIAQFEEKILIDMLGKTLFDLFNANVDPLTLLPVDQIYLDIYEPVSIGQGHCEQTSIGMKDMLLGLIWFEYTRKAPYKQSMNGVVNNQTETSTPAHLTFIYPIYNESVKSYNIIRRYCYENGEVYPTMGGSPKRHTSWV